MTSSQSAGRATLPESDLIPDELLSTATPDELAEYEAYLTRELWRVDPARWAAERLGEAFWSKQVEIAESVVAHRRTAVRSCHSAGKSYTAARMAAWWIDTHPLGEAFVLTTAPTFSQVRSILWREMNRAHRHGHLPGRMNQTEWWVRLEGDEEQVGMGRKPSDYDEEAFQGIHARYVLVIIDEACGVPEQIWTAADSIASNEHARILAIGNPDDPTSHFAQVCKEGSGWHRLKIAAEETPNFTGEEVPEDVAELLLAPAWVEEKRREWGESNPLFVSKVRAEFPEVSDDTAVPLGWIMRAVERELTPSTPHILGVDIARFGSDESVIAERWGAVARIRARWRGEDTQASAGRVHRALEDSGAAEAHVDVIGIGAGVVDRLREEHQPVKEANAGEAAHDKEHFLNARAEWWWALRTRAEQGDLDLPNDEELIAQLAGPRYQFTGRGQIKIEAKEDMKKRGLRSPDLADAVVIAFAASLRPSSPAGASVDPEPIRGQLGLRQSRWAS